MATHRDQVFDSGKFLNVLFVCYQNLLLENCRETNTLG